MKKIISHLMIWGILLSVLGSATPAFADGIIIIDPPPDVPIMEVPDLAIKYHRVKIGIDEQIAETYVDQVFVNESRREWEGTYIFPLPEDAAVSEFTMDVDGEQVTGELLEKDEARRIYERIVNRRRDPGLLEYIGRNTFRARVYPIPARGEKRVEVSYSEILEMDGGIVKYVYPLDTERFSSKPLEEVVITVDLHSARKIKSIYSPSHDIEVVRDGDYHAYISFEEYDVKPDRDFVLYYTVSEKDFGVSLISYKERGEDGFFVLLAAPNVRIKERERVAKDVICVLDTSGSMKGEKIAQAKDALEFILNNLHEDDRFNIVTFSTGVHSYARGLRPADERRRALDFVREINARGGTNINRALLTALDMTATGRPQLIIFLTDGLATEGEVETDNIIANVAKAAPTDVRLFTFGVGYDVNTILLDTLAEQHRGASSYVEPGENIEDEVSSFYAKISTPLLSNISLDFGEIEVEDTYPYPLPDLFVGSQLVLVGRYRAGGATTITLRGEVNDRESAFVYEDITFSERGGADFIPRLWATRKVGYLLTQIRLHGESQELVDEIVDLSIRYGIMTPYTSFLVREDEDVLREESRDRLSRDVVESIAPTDAPVSGAGAVEKSITLRGYSEAEVAEEIAEEHQEQIKLVGDKSFINRDGVWTDTTFKPERMEPVKLSFSSESYFDFLAEHAAWSKYFAIGRRVIVVLDGQAYEVVESDAEVEEIPDVPTVEENTTAPATPTIAPSEETFWQRILREILDLLR